MVPLVRLLHLYLETQMKNITFISAEGTNTFYFLIKPLSLKL